MENFNWKYHLKESAKSMLSDLLYMFCVLITFTLVFLTQTENQIKLIADLFNEGDWIFLFMAGVGLLALSAVTEKIFKAIIWLIKSPIAVILRNLKKSKP